MASFKINSIDTTTGDVNITYTFDEDYGTVTATIKNWPVDDRAELLQAIRSWATAYMNGFDSQRPLSAAADVINLVGRSQTL